jgi:ribosomal protein L37AE/L43A
MENKKIVHCSSCNRKLGVPTGKHIIFECPHCKAKQELFYSGVYIPVESEQTWNTEKVACSTKVVEILKRKMQKEFIIILN